MAKPGWYQQGDQLRYWDGVSWTDRFRPVPQTPDPPPVGAPVAIPVAAKPLPTTGLGGWWRRQRPAMQLALVLAVIIVVGLALVIDGIDKRPTTAEKTFLAGLGSVQADEPDSQLIQVGHDMCAALRQGESPSALTRFFGAKDRLIVGLQQGVFLSAVTAPGSICPDQLPVVERWSNSR